MRADLPKMPEPEAYFGVNENGRWVEAPKHCDPAGYTPMWSYDHMRAFAQEAARQAMERIEPLRRAGAMLSNCAFNLVQRDPGQFTARDIEALDSSRKAWDEALRALLPHDTEKRHGNV